MPVLLAGRGWATGAIRAVTALGGATGLAATAPAGAFIDVTTRKRAVVIVAAVLTVASSALMRYIAARCRQRHVPELGLRLAFHQVPGETTVKNRFTQLITADFDRLRSPGASVLNEVTGGTSRWTTIGTLWSILRYQKTFHGQLAR